MQEFVDPVVIEKFETSNAVLPNKESTAEDFIIANSWFFWKKCNGLIKSRKLIENTLNKNAWLVNDCQQLT